MHQAPSIFCMIFRQRLVYLQPEREVSKMVGPHIWVCEACCSFVRPLCSCHNSAPVNPSNPMRHRREATASPCECLEITIVQQHFRPQVRCLDPTRRPLQAGVHPVHPVGERPAKPPSCHRLASVSVSRFGLHQHVSHQPKQGVYRHAFQAALLLLSNVKHMSKIQLELMQRDAPKNRINRSRDSPYGQAASSPRRVWCGVTMPCQTPLNSCIARCSVATLA